MNSTTPAAPAAASVREVPADVIPLLPAAREKVRDAKMNPVEKSDRLMAILNAISPDGCWPGSGFVLRNYTSEEERAAAEAARRKNLWAEYYAIKETELVSDLTEERRAYFLRDARKRLADWQPFAHAATIVRTIEVENLDLEAPSATRKCLDSRADEIAKDVCDALSYALEAHDLLFLTSFVGRGGRRARFRIERNEAGWPRPVRLIDATVRGPRCLRMGLQWYVEHAMTLTEIRRLLQIWATEATAVRRDGSTVMVGEGFEIFPV